MNKFTRIGEVADMCGVSTSRVQAWTNTGKLPAGQRVFCRTIVNEFLGFSSNKPAENQTLVLYIRASDGSKTLLDTQLTILYSSISENVNVGVAKASGSGLNTNRLGLKRMMCLAGEGKVTEVCFINKDQLTCFGYQFLEQYFQTYNVNPVKVDPEGKKTLEAQLS